MDVWVSRGKHSNRVNFDCRTLVVRWSGQWRIFERPGWQSSLDMYLVVVSIQVPSVSTYMPSTEFVCRSDGPTVKSHGPSTRIMQRLKQISSHLYPPSGVAALQEKRPDDVVITMAIRSPLTKAKKGALKDTP